MIAAQCGLLSEELVGTRETSQAFPRCPKSSLVQGFLWNLAGPLAGHHF